MRRHFGRPRVTVMAFETRASEECMLGHLARCVPAVQGGVFLRSTALGCHRGAGSARELQVLVRPDGPICAPRVEIAALRNRPDAARRTFHAAPSRQNARMVDAVRWFPGGGEMGERVRTFAWASTPLGAIETWSQTLQTAVRILLDSRYPMFVWWGPELINIYNDSYCDVLGQRHPAALGQPAQEIWHDIWDAINPLVRTVVEEERATFNTELELFMERNGYVEETYFTFSYSPLRDESSGTRGLFCACLEDTERVIAERRLSLLRALGTSNRTVHSVDEALGQVAHAFAGHARDIAFSALYRVSSDGRELVLEKDTGLEDHRELAPATVDLVDGDEIVEMPGAPRGIDAAVLRAVLDSGERRRIASADVGQPMPGGAWPEPAPIAKVLPVTRGGEDRVGVLVLGACPRRPYDESYSQFFELVANAVSSVITTAEAYENERRRADELAELDRAKTVFFGNVSHEFRTPLTLMMAPIEDLIEGGSLSESAREQLTIARRNGLRLLKLVNTLLDFSRIEAGRMQARFRPLELGRVTEEIASMFRSAVEGAGLAFRVDCERIGAPVYVDADMWEKIVMNLLSNALKNTLEGEIHLQLRRIGEDICELAVVDTGIGISRDQQLRVFDRFHRVEGAQGRTQEGTGIGLALVRELCALHAGSVTVESELGEGAIFRVRLPLGKSHLPNDRVDEQATSVGSGIGVAPYLEEALRWMPETEKAVPIAEPLDTQHAGAAGRPLVLVADDNADMRAYLARLLGERYEVVLVGDGDSALRLAVERRPNLVLSDVMMPGLDGFALLERLRDQDQTRAIPVVLLSARAGEEARAEGLEAGANDYIVKPFHARELLARVAAQIELATVRRDAESRIMAVLEESTSGFVLLDRDRRYRYVNATAEAILGRTRDAMLGSSLTDVFPEIEGTDALGFIDQASIEPIERELYIDPWDRWFKIKARPAQGGGVAMQFDDVTLARRALDTMRETDRRKDEFLATLAHELRNPLAPIRNALKVLLQDDGESQRVDELYRMMDRQTDHLSSLVDDLMEVSRITRGKVELHSSKIDARTAIENACESARPDISGRRQSLSVELPSDPVFVEADPVRLTQIVANLLGNASKYTPDGGRIDLKLATAPSGDEVQIVVEDDGIGIPAEQLDRVFEPFLQRGGVDSRERGGLGLGLTVVRHLVVRHGGRVDVSSAGPGRGSTFTVTLPRCAAPETSPASRDEQAGSGPGVRVLVVDDNADAADSLAMLFEMDGHDVRVCYDGTSAIEAVDAHDPAIVLLDIGLPDVDGHAVARTIRERPGGKARTLIAVTGWGQDADRDESSKAGFDHHVVKPVDWFELQRTIASKGMSP